MIGVAEYVEGTPDGFNEAGALRLRKYVEIIFAKRMGMASMRPEH